jgi:hypothetical protein
MAPDRPQPRRIANGPRRNMQVKLTNHVAKRADIDLIRPRMSFQESRGTACLVHQLRLVHGLEIGQFDEVVASWNENAPWSAGVVHQEHTA